MPDGASGPSPAELGISPKDLGIKEGGPVASISREPNPQVGTGSVLHDLAQPIRKEESTRATELVGRAASQEGLSDLNAPISLEDVIYAPSIDLTKGLTRNGIDPVSDLQAKIRAAKSIGELRELGLSDDILRSIKEGTLIIKDDEIPAWMRDKVQEMIQYAISNGAEQEEGVGNESGFYHVHIGVPKGTVFTGNKQAVWEQVQQNATLLLGHTQELKAFDKSKRSIVLGLKEGDKAVILPTANPEGTVQIADPQLTQAGFPETIDAGTLYFYDGQGKGRQFSSTLTVG